jgi:lipoprotein NlpD
MRSTASPPSNAYLARWLSIGALAALTALSGCATRGPNDRAPVEDRGTSRPATAPGTSAPVSTATPSTVNPATATVPTRPPPGIENLGRPGYYQIRPGDTLIRIGLETGQSWRDIARWNGLDNPNIIEVGQVIRIVQPGTATAAPGTPGAPFIPPVAASPAPASPSPTAPAPGGVVTSPVATSPGVTGTSLPPAATRTTPVVTSTPAPTPAPVASAPTAPAAGGDEEVSWIWPSSGAIIDRFDEVKNKGLDIGGKLGDPVLAAADGRVVYAGAGLRGYGNLIILKHNNTYLTAYAHNQVLLVKEDQTVRRGQKIAEMGQSDSDKVKLHFEVRRQGKPVDPLRFLPARP